MDWVRCTGCRMMIMGTADSHTCEAKHGASIEDITDCPLARKPNAFDSMLRAVEKKAEEVKRKDVVESG